MTELQSGNLVKRPVGIWLLTISVAIFAGLVPLAGTIFFLFNTEMLGGLDIGMFRLVGGITLALSILYFSWGVWRGDTRAKKILLGLVLVHWGFIIVNNIQWLMNDELMAQMSGDQKSKPVTNIVRSAFWILAVYWYLLSSKPRDFFASRGAN